MRLKQSKHQFHFQVILQMIIMMEKLLMAVSEVEEECSKLKEIEIFTGEI